MSNYYHRDNEGNWFVKRGKDLFHVEFSGSLEIAYQMGKTTVLEELYGRIHENLMQIGDTQIWEVGTAPVSAEKRPETM